MSNIQIVVDSMTDIPKNLVEKYNIVVVPLTIHFDNEEYRDGIDLTGEEFYSKLTQVKELPKTSQVAPNIFLQVFKGILEEGKEIICINGSSKASGTHQNAVLAKTQLETEKIVIFDTMSLCFGAGFFAYEAAKMAADNKSTGEIIERLRKMKSNVDHIFTVDTLEYLKKGGRLNPMKATIATILNVKPILTVEEGLVESLDKVRGSKKVINKMLDLAKERGSDFSNKAVAIAHANNPRKAEELKEMVEKELKPQEILITEIGCTIGTHAGPGTLAIFYEK
ncbi:EDD domain protein, DegV family [Natronincola peptidivorans]|uniref:EDD domain protein, DegV family n=1 Tax=Natronincola peptidivorans TaxID=426128 RepID=A0A1I0H7H5_9FIRM|nr:DegV family protein [Natronincola peptidivorans]SET79599.1 EDD domain protein, DegV family [Natronincola peptidivorans]